MKHLMFIFVSSHDKTLIETLQLPLGQVDVGQRVLEMLVSEIRVAFRGPHGTDHTSKEIIGPPPFHEHYHIVLHGGKTLNP